VPGRYTVRLTASGQRYEQPLVVAPDPRTEVSADVLSARLAFQKRIVGAMGVSFDTLEAAKDVRKQRKAGAGDEADGRLAALEADLSRTNRTLGTILTQVEAADAPPTSVQTATLAETLQALEAQLARWKLAAGQR